MTRKEEKKADWYWEIWNKKTNKPNEVIAWLIVEKAKLEEENKKLKEKYNWLWDIYTRDVNERIEENKKLKSDLAYERTMLDNVKAEYESSQNVIKELKEELISRIRQPQNTPYWKWVVDMVTDEHNRIILEKGEDGKRHSYWSGVVLC